MTADVRDSIHWGYQIRTTEIIQIKLLDQNTEFETVFELIK